MHSVWRCLLWLGQQQLRFFAIWTECGSYRWCGSLTSTARQYPVTPLVFIFTLEIAARIAVFFVVVDNSVNHIECNEHICLCSLATFKSRQSVLLVHATCEVHTRICAPRAPDDGVSEGVVTCWSWGLCVRVRRTAGDVGPPFLNRNDHDWCHDGAINIYSLCFPVDISSEMPAAEVNNKEVITV